MSGRGAALGHGLCGGGGGLASQPTVARAYSSTAAELGSRPAYWVRLVRAGTADRRRAAR